MSFSSYETAKFHDVVEQFGLIKDVEASLFVGVPPVAPGRDLRDHLERWSNRAILMPTEAARREYIIFPVLIEAVSRSKAQVILYPGVFFNVSVKEGLVGYCDYLLSRGADPMTIEGPVLAVVEAKNEDMKRGIGQCAAEMVAAQRFNSERERSAAVFGLVTDGASWRFLKLDGPHILIDRRQYGLKEIDIVLGNLIAIAREEA